MPSAHPPDAIDAISDPYRPSRLHRQLPHHHPLHQAVTAWAQQRLQPAHVTLPPIPLRVPAQNALQDFKQHLQTYANLDLLQTVNAMSSVATGRLLSACLRDTFNDADIKTLWSHNVRILTRLQWRTQPAYTS